jgi:hypothetical protein
LFYVLYGFLKIINSDILTIDRSRIELDKPVKDDLHGIGMAPGGIVVRNGYRYCPVLPDSE